MKFTYKKKEKKEELIGRNWKVEIVTSFKNMEDFTNSYIKEWEKLINSKLISFIMYRFNDPLDAENENRSPFFFSISCYLELTKKYSSTWLVKF
jgi:hypothetical protein